MPKIPASEREAFFEKRRQEISDVALRVWAERGFGTTSVAAIADAAGISKGTFYLYFESKDALLADVFRRHSLAPNLVQMLETLPHVPLEEAVHGFVRAAWRHLSEKREIVLLALGELPSQIDHAQALFERVMLPLNAALAAYLEERIPPERAAKLALPIAGRSLMGTVLFTFLTQEILGAKRSFPIPEEEVTSTIAELFLRGVASR